ncbi:hypothetical protein DER44DRAFT_796684 [Fusarium oxysporum]|nr:hypothetical protein DER44DRAFT_796684 [Fusarium oxysporum]
MCLWINREIEEVVAGGGFSADFSGKSQHPRQNGATRTLGHGIPVREKTGEATLCPRRRFLGGAPASPHSHLWRPLGELFDYTVRGVRGMRRSKPPLENDGAADSEIDAKDEQVRAKLLE